MVQNLTRERTSNTEDPKLSNHLGLTEIGSIFPNFEKMFI